MTSPALSALDAYRHMSIIRAFELKALELSTAGEIAGSIHLALGQEAIPVGAVAALSDHDRVLSTYRGHGWALASGAPLVGVLAELAQRSGGVNGGRGGSPLLSYPDAGFMGENSIVGAGVPIADGVALAAVAQGTGRVVVASIGDGAMNQGATTEGMIFAAARNLPVVFICENNGWAEMTPSASMIRGDDLVGRAKSMGIESRLVDGNDPIAVQVAVADAAQKCRDGKGPVFLECKTHRLKGHYNKDIEHYRSDEDKLVAASNDPLELIRASAIAGGTATADDFAGVDADVVRLINDAADAVLAMPLPDAETVLQHLYGPTVSLAEDDPAPAKDLPYWRAVNLALETELATRPEVAIYGEDVGLAGGIFGVTRNLAKTFGNDRVFDTPISESAILGSAVGAAMEGMRPVVEIMWADFVFVALDQIINQASNVRYVSRSRLSAPMTIRMQQGVTPGSCAQHSQSIEAFFAHIPGIKVGLPSTPQDAYDMLRASVADPDPTVIIEHRALYMNTGPVSTSTYARERAEGAKLRRDGTDLVIISWGAMVVKALEAAERLALGGVQAAVLDLRWLRPLDDAAIAGAVERSGGRVLIVHEATTTGGFGAEVAARISSTHFGRLAAPVTRLGTPDIRMPSAPNLQDVLVPSASAIVDASLAVAGRPTVPA